jgi:hypothetical protein
MPPVTPPAEPVVEPEIVAPVTPTVALPDPPPHFDPLYGQAGSFHYHPVTGALVRDDK